MRKDRILFQFLLIIASVGCVLTATIGYLISVPLVRTLAESEKLPLRLFSDEIFSFASDSFHDLLDARNEDNPSVVETSKQDVLARIAYFKPLDSANLYHFIVLDDEKRILVDTDRILQEAGMTEISEEATEGDVRLTDRNGKTLIGYLKYFPAWRWRMIAVVHEEDLKKKIIWLKILIYGAGTLGFLSLVVAFSFILKKRIQEPLTKLVSHANRLKEGRYDALPERWVGEMGELSSAFSRMADAIREREQKLFELAKFPQSNPNLLMKVSPEGKILYINPSVEKMLAENGHSGSQADRLLPPDIPEICKGVRFSDGYKKEITLRVFDRTIEYTIFGFADEDSVVFHGTDVTERKRMEEQLSHAHKMENLGRIAGGVAHDFNNLLAGILGYASLLKSYPLGDEKVMKAVGSIEKAAERGTQLTRQLLGFARKGTHEHHPLDLNRIVDETADIVSQTFVKSIAIRCDKADDLPPIKGDGAQVHQCLMNLCINSRDAMPEGGELSIRTKRVLYWEARQEKYFQIPAGLYSGVEVTDKGQGMDEVTQERIFDPFFTTKVKDKGTGLGMSMVYAIVKSHGGFITLRSAKGRGTTVEVLFPAGDAVPAAPEISESAPPPVPRTETGATVLLVDDEEVVRDVGRAMLDTLGYEVLLAANGKEGVEVFRRNREKISMVILDLMMPVMDGKKAFEEIRRIDPRARVIISTGFSGDEDVDILKEMGASAILPKPYSYDTMTRVITLPENR